MAADQIRLLAARRFAPLFAAMFLAAFNDNFFRNVLAFGIVYGVLDVSSADPGVLITLATAVFILPFFLFSALGGQLAAKYPKDAVIRAVKLAEIAIVAVAAASLFARSPSLMLLALFMLGAQSALFAPSRLATLPQHLGEAELLAGNGLLSAGSFLAILSGTILGGLVVTGFSSAAAVAAMFVVAVLGYAASRAIPPAPAPAPDAAIGWNFARETVAVLRLAFRQSRGVSLSILGVAWFYLIGATYITQFPVFAKETLRVDETVLAFFLVLFSIGIAAGALMNNALFRGRINAVCTPFAAAGIALMSLSLWLLDPVPPNGGHLVGLGEFMERPDSFRICGTLFLVAALAGLYVVPLNAVIQGRTTEDVRSKVIAASAILDSFLIVISSIAVAALLALGATVQDVFLALAVTTSAFAVGIRALPDHVRRLPALDE